MSKRVLPIFSSRSFMVSGLLFRPLNYFEFIFVYGIKKYSSSCPVFPTPLIEEIVFFSIVYSSLLCYRWNYHKCVGLNFWAFYSVPLIYVSVFVPIPCFFDYHSFTIYSEFRSISPLKNWKMIETSQIWL